MISNITMKKLLSKHKIRSIHRILPDDAYPIWKKCDAVGRPYWGVASFWGMDKQPIPSHQNLSQLEWDGNEIHLEATSPEDVTNILRKAVGIMRFWKEYLEARYPDTPFYLIATFNDGNVQILDADDTPTQSVTLRFWAERGSNDIIALDDFKIWEQPAIIGYCNFRHIG